MNSHTIQSHDAILTHMNDSNNNMVKKMSKWNNNFTNTTSAAILCISDNNYQA